MKPFLAYLTPELRERLRALSFRTGRSMSSLLRDAVAEYVRRAPAKTDGLPRFIGCVKGRKGDRTSERASEVARGIILGKFKRGPR